MNRLRREAPLVLAALFIAFVIWLIAMQGDRESSWVTVPIKLEQAQDNLLVQITSPRVAQVAINVQFPREQRSRIVEKNFTVSVPVADVVSGDPEQWTLPAKAKLIRYNLTVNNVVHGLPAEVHVIEIDPDRIELEARLRELELAVEVPTTGALPSQFQLTDRLIPQPAAVFVTGSEKRLAELAEQGRKIYAQPVDLSTVAQSGQIIRELTVPDGVLLLNKLEARVAVNVGLQEKSAPRTFPAVPVTLPVSPMMQARLSPAAVDITVEGPPSALNQIAPDSFSFATSKALEERPGRTQEVALEVGFRTRVPLELSRRLKITAVNPPRISVEFVPLIGQNGGGDAPSE